jgi:hypothetical protein
MKRFMNKKVATIGLAAGLVLGIGGAAFAYFDGSGTGTGDTTAGSGHTVTLHATIGGTSAIVPGDGGQPVTFTADNANATSVKVATISFGGVTSGTPDCQTFLTANPGEFTMVTVTSGTVVPGNTSAPVALAGTGHLVWADSATADQTPCEGASLTLTVNTP